MLGEKAQKSEFERYPEIWTKGVTKMKIGDLLLMLCDLAKLSNTAAKELDGAGRAFAYRMKSEILSTLIVEGSASVNGVKPNGTVGLDIQADPPFRLHVPLTQLHPRARAEARRQMSSVPAMASIGEILKQKQ